MTGLVSIIIPTIPGREEHFERNLAAYQRETSLPFEILVEYDHPTVGLAWEAGARKASGDYIALSCDDLEAQPGWDKAAIQACDQGCIPAPRVVNGITGALESRPVWGAEVQDGTDCGISVVPFMSRAQYEKIAPFLTVHYFTDDWISYRARKAGWPSLMANGYCFRHYWAQHRRGAGMTEAQRMTQDQHAYIDAMAMDARGEWTAPWPEVPDMGKGRP